MENKETVLTNTEVKETCISRIKAKWSQRSRGFKIYYILLWILSLICFGICVWSLIFVDTTRQDIYNTLSKDYSAFLNDGANAWTAEQWQAALNNTGTTVNDQRSHFYAVMHENYYDDLDKYSWMWASRPDVWKVVDTPVTRLSYICYALFIVFAFIWAPVTVYCVASFLNVAFPHISKKERKALKAAQKEQSASPKKDKTKKPQKAKPKKQEKTKQESKEDKMIVKAVPAVIHDAPNPFREPKRKKLKGDWLYYHERQKYKSSDGHKGGSR